MDLIFLVQKFSNAIAAADARLTGNITPVVCLQQRTVYLRGCVPNYSRVTLAINAAKPLAKEYGLRLKHEVHVMQL